MSYDLAVWEGARPTGDVEAGAAFEELHDRFIAGETTTPTPAIAAYVEALLARWPDITEDAGEDSPWSDGPLIGNASGSLCYFGMVYGMAEEGLEFAARVAAEQGLVCFDPQAEAIVSG
jgi:hypothetical protein